MHTLYITGIDKIKVIMQGKLIAVAYNLRTYFRTMSDNLVGKIIQKLFNNYGKLLIIPIPSQLNKLLSSWVNSKRFWTLWTRDISFLFALSCEGKKLLYHVVFWKWIKAQITTGQSWQSISRPMWLKCLFYKRFLFYFKFFTLLILIS